MGGMANAVSFGLSLITQQYTLNNLNDGNLPMVYYINAIFAVLGCGLYYWVSKARKVTPAKVLENKGKVTSVESNTCIEAYISGASLLSFCLHEYKLADVFCP